VFDVKEFVSACVHANAETEPRRAVRELLDRALATPGGVADTMAPTEAGFTLLHHTPELTVLHIVWAPGMVLYPHDHRMWAVIGIYAGREDNAFFRRNGTALTESGGKELQTGDSVILGDNTIHSVANPTDRLTGALHVYGGDFVNQPRSQWGPGPVEERPYDFDGARQHFADANAAWRS